MQLPLGKMNAVGAISPPLCASSSSTPTSFRRSNSNLSIGSQFNPSSSSSSSSSSLFLSTSPLRFSLLPPRCKRSHNLTAHAASSSSSSSSVGKEAYAEEPATKVKFLTSLTLPGCSSPLSLVGTGYREKVFAIIGVKVYAAGVYMNQSIFPKLNAWKGKSVTDIQEDESLFTTIFQAPLEKSLQIVLVRDIDGKTFWDALDDAVTPRITLITPVDQSALSRFRSIFQGRSLNKGTIIFLTWLDSSKMLVSVSSDGMPTGVEAMIESQSVTSALFDVFLGDAPVSPSLKASVADGLATVLK